MKLVRFDASILWMEGENFNGSEKMTSKYVGSFHSAKDAKKALELEAQKILFEVNADFSTPVKWEWVKNRFIHGSSVFHSFYTKFGSTCTIIMYYAKKVPMEDTEYEI